MTWVEERSTPNTTTKWYQALRETSTTSPVYEQSHGGNRRRQLKHRFSCNKSELGLFAAEYRNQKLKSLWWDYGGTLLLCIIIGGLLIGGGLIFQPNGLPLPAQTILLQKTPLPPTLLTLPFKVFTRVNRDAEDRDLCTFESPCTVASSGATNTSQHQAIELLLKNTRNMEYTINIKIGNARNSEVSSVQGNITGSRDDYTFSMIIDTGSSNMWVASESCGDSCAGHQHYKKKADLTTAQPFKIEYGEGKVEGFWATDNVQIGGLLVKDVEFGSVTSVSEFNPPFSKSPEFDGVLGLGWPALAVDNKQTLLDAMVAQGIIQKAMFSLQLGNGKDGQFVIGGYDAKSINGPIHWLYMDKQILPTYWEANLNRMDVTVRSKMIDIIISFPTSAKSIVFDSGTSYFAGAMSDVASLADSIGAKKLSFGQSLSDGQYFIECNKTDLLPNIEFDLSADSNGSKQMIVIPPEDYVVKPIRRLFKDEGMCVFAFLPVDLTSAPKWILGDIFMRRYYTVFDLAEKRIGFAPSDPHK